MKRIFLSAFLYVTSLFGFSQSTGLDITFGTNGVVITSIGVATSVIHNLAIQLDGKIVVAGTSCDGNITEFGIARYNTDGSLDNTFNGNGKITTNFGSQAEAFSVAIQSDGKIVAAGYMYTDSTWEFAIGRYNTDGTVDNSFGENGKIHTPVGNIDDEINAVAIQPDGKIVAAGYSNSAADINDFLPQIAIVRYNSDGSLDNTFNGNGKLTTSFGLFDIAYSVAIQTDGKIIIGGTHVTGSNYEFLVVRYQSNGSFDNTFNGTGKVITSIGNNYDVIHSITIQTDGKIVAAGTSAVGANYDNYNFALARYNSNGDLDTTFDDDGKVITLLNSHLDISPSVALQVDGKIVVAGGISSNGTTHDMVLARYNDNGTLDNTFDGDGKVTTSIDGKDNIYTMKVSGPRVYVAGSNDQFLVAAYQNNVFTLPINLLSFTAAIQNTVTELKWQTTGQSISFFKIERSRDGKKFATIGNQSSLMNNSFQQNYSFRDKELLKGTNFYRLKIVETGGSFTYSKIIAVRSNDNSTTTKIFPNPATDLILLQIPSSQKESIAIQIRDVNNNIIKSEIISSAGTTISTSINVALLQKGSYFLSVKTTLQKQVMQFIKQ